MAGVVEMLVPMQRLVLVLAREEQPEEVIMDLERRVEAGEAGQPGGTQQGEAQPGNGNQGEPGLLDQQEGPEPGSPPGLVRPASQQQEEQHEQEVTGGDEGRDEQLQPDAAVQEEPLPQRQGGRRAAARQADLLMRQPHQPISPPRQGGRRMLWRR